MITKATVMLLFDIFNAILKRLIYDQNKFIV